MGIQNFPPALQPIIQQGFLEREFQQALRSRLGYRAVADREEIAVGIGETLTKTRAGLKPSVTTPLAPALNTNLDNGLTTTGWGIEQYTLTLNFYAATADLNMVTSRVGIASQFLQNAYTNGEQAARSLDELARNALFNAYFGGNTRVTVSLGAAGTTIAVDDMRGLQTVFVNGVQVPVSVTNPLAVTVGANVYTLVGATPDAVSVSTAPNGVSGTLTFSSNVSVSDGAEYSTVQAATASAILRPAGRTNTALIQANDSLTMGNLLDAVATLRKNAVPEIDGVYNCYLDPVSARQLFADPDFKTLFTGATSSNAVFHDGMVNDFLGLRFIPTTEAFVQAHPTIAGLNIRRPIICGQGALIEGDFAGIGADAGANGSPTGRDGAKAGARRDRTDAEPASAFASAPDGHRPGAGCATGGAASSAPAARPHADRATGSGYAAPRASRAAGFYPAAFPRVGSAAGPDSATRDVGPDRFGIAAPRDRGTAATSIPGAAIAPG